MTKDDIIKLAREAAAKHGHTFRDVPQTETIEFLEAFFLLASEAEREQCAKLAEKTICDVHIFTGVSIYGTRAAKAIRARGNT